MTLPWVLCLSRDDGAALAVLRLLSGVEVAETSNQLWVRGPAGDDQLALTLAALPALDRFERADDQKLRRLGRRIPSENPPPLSWQPLSSWLRIESPPAALPADPPRPVELRLVPSAGELDAELLLVAWEEWEGFVNGAAQVRLQRLRFAAATDRHVIVQGIPLPPIPGRRYVRRGRIAVPAGLRWHPEIGTDVVARRFSVGEGALALWHEDGTLTRLHEEHFVPASRSAARATAEAFPP